MAVWVVTYHDYEDNTSEIEAVFSTEELAISYMKRYGFKFYSAHEHIVDKEN